MLNLDVIVSISPMICILMEYQKVKLLDNTSNNYLNLEQKIYFKNWWSGGTSLQVIHKLSSLQVYVQQFYVITVMYTYSSVPNNSIPAFFSKKYPSTLLLLDLRAPLVSVISSSVIRFSLFLEKTWNRIMLLRKILKVMRKKCFIFEVWISFLELCSKS